MGLASLVLRINPHQRTAAEAALSAFPGAALSDTLIAIHRIPEVLAATLAFEANDSLLADTPNTDCSDSYPCEETSS